MPNTPSTYTPAAKTFYDNLINDDYNLGTYGEFLNNMSDPIIRKQFYDNLIGDGYQLGDTNQFNQVVDDGITVGDPESVPPLTAVQPRDRVQLNESQEQEFRDFWMNDEDVHAWKIELGYKPPDVDKDPDDPRDKYDYRKAWLGGSKPEMTYNPDNGEYERHWDSEGKDIDHPTSYENRPELYDDPQAVALPHTLASLITKYTPPTENDTMAYVDSVAKSLGVTPNTSIMNIDSQLLSQAIAKQEGFFQSVEWNLQNNGRETNYSQEWNNPHMLEFREQEGASPSPEVKVDVEGKQKVLYKEGRFAVFPTPEDGFAAGIRQIEKDKGQSWADPTQFDLDVAHKIARNSALPAGNPLKIADIEYPPGSGIMVSPILIDDKRKQKEKIDKEILESDDPMQKMKDLKNTANQIEGSGMTESGKDQLRRLLEEQRQEYEGSGLPGDKLDLEQETTEGAPDFYTLDQLVFAEERQALNIMGSEMTGNIESLERAIEPWQKHIDDRYKVGEKYIVTTEDDAKAIENLNLQLDKFRDAVGQLEYTLPSEKKEIEELVAEIKQLNSVEEIEIEDFNYSIGKIREYYSSIKTRIDEYNKRYKDFEALAVEFKESPVLPMKASKGVIDVLQRNQVTFGEEHSYAYYHKIEQRWITDSKEVEDIDRITGYTKFHDRPWWLVKVNYKTGDMSIEDMIDISEAEHHSSPDELLPVWSALKEAGEMGIMFMLTDRVSKGETLSPSESEFLLTSLDRMNRESTYGAMSFDIARQSLPFMLEFVIGGAIWKTGEKLAIKAGGEVMERYLQKEAGGELLEWMLRAGSNRGLRLAGKWGSKFGHRIGAPYIVGDMAGRVESDMYRRMTPHMMVVREGRSYNIETLAPGLTRELAEQKAQLGYLGEVFSESTGFMMLGIPRGVRNLAIKSGMIKAIRKANPQIPAPKWRNFVRENFFLGTLPEEVFEERVNEIYKALVLDEEYHLPTWKQLAAEITGFLPMTGMGYGISYVHDKKVTRARVKFDQFLQEDIPWTDLTEKEVKLALGTFDEEGIERIKANWNTSGRTDALMHEWADAGEGEEGVKKRLAVLEMIHKGRGKVTFDSFVTAQGVILESLQHPRHQEILTQLEQAYNTWINNEGFTYVDVDSYIDNFLNNHVPQEIDENVLAGIVGVKSRADFIAVLKGHHKQSMELSALIKQVKADLVYEYEIEGATYQGSVLVTPRIEELEKELGELEAMKMRTVHYINYMTENMRPKDQPLTLDPNQAIEKFQWMANKESGQTAGNKEIVQPLTKALFNEWVLTRVVDYETLKEYKADYPDASHISLIQREDGRVIFGGVGSMDDLRPKAEDDRWVIPVDSFESEEAQQQAISVDSELPALELWQTIQPTGIEALSFPPPIDKVAPTEEAPPTEEVPTEVPTIEVPAKQPDVQGVEDFDKKLIDQALDKSRPSMTQEAKKEFAKGNYIPVIIDGTTFVLGVQPDGSIGNVGVFEDGKFSIPIAIPEPFGMMSKEEMDVFSEVLKSGTAPPTKMEDIISEQPEKIGIPLPKEMEGDIEELESGAKIVRIHPGHWGAYFYQKSNNFPEVTARNKIKFDGKEWLSIDNFSGSVADAEIGRFGDADFDMYGLGNPQTMVEIVPLKDYKGKTTLYKATKGYGEDVEEGTGSAPGVRFTISKKEYVFTDNVVTALPQAPLDYDEFYKGVDDKQGAGDVTQPVATKRLKTNLEGLPKEIKDKIIASEDKYWKRQMLVLPNMIGGEDYIFSMNIRKSDGYDGQAYDSPVSMRRGKIKPGWKTHMNTQSSGLESYGVPIQFDTFAKAIEYAQMPVKQQDIYDASFEMSLKIADEYNYKEFPEGIDYITKKGNLNNPESIINNPEGIITELSKRLKKDNIDLYELWNSGRTGRDVVTQALDKFNENLGVYVDTKLDIEKGMTAAQEHIIDTRREQKRTTGIQERTGLEAPSSLWVAEQEVETRDGMIAHITRQEQYLKRVKQKVKEELLIKAMDTLTPQGITDEQLKELEEENEAVAVAHPERADEIAEIIERGRYQDPLEEMAKVFAEINQYIESKGGERYSNPYDMPEDVANAVWKRSKLSAIMMRSMGNQKNINQAKTEEDRKKWESRLEKAIQQIANVVAIPTGDHVPIHDVEAPVDKKVEVEKVQTPISSKKTLAKKPPLPKKVGKPSQPHTFHNAIRPKGASLPILQKVIVRDGKMYSTDLEVISEAPTTLEDGMYDVKDKKFIRVGEISDEYPTLITTMPRTGKNNSISKPKTSVKIAIMPHLGRSVHAVSKDSLKPALTGVLFKFDGNGWLELVSTDGHRLNVETIYVGTKVAAGTYIVPAKAIKAILKDKSTAELNLQFSEGDSIGDGRFRIEGGTYAVSGRLINEKFPDYRSVIPTQVERIKTFNRKDLLAALNELKSYVNSSTKQISVYEVVGGVQLIAFDSAKKKDDESRVKSIFVKAESFEGSPIIIENVELLMPVRMDDTVSQDTIPGAEESEWGAGFNIMYLIDIAKSHSGDTMYWGSGTAISPTIWSDSPFAAAEGEALQVYTDQANSLVADNSALSKGLADIESIKKGGQFAHYHSYGNFMYRDAVAAYNKEVDDAHKELTRINNEVKGLGGEAIKIEIPPKVNLIDLIQYIPFNDLHGQHFTFTDGRDAKYRRNGIIWENAHLDSKDRDIKNVDKEGNILGIDEYTITVTGKSGKDGKWAEFTIDLGEVEFESARETLINVLSDTKIISDIRDKFVKEVEKSKEKEVIKKKQSDKAPVPDVWIESRVWIASKTKEYRDSEDDKKRDINVMWYVQKNLDSGRWELIRETEKVRANTSEWKVAMLDENVNRADLQAPSETDFVEADKYGKDISEITVTMPPPAVDRMILDLRKRRHESQDTWDLYDAMSFLTDVMFENGSFGGVLSWTVESDDTKNYVMSTINILREEISDMETTFKNLYVDYEKKTNVKDKEELNQQIVPHDVARWMAYVEKLAELENQVYDELEQTKAELKSEGVSNADINAIESRAERSSDKEVKAIADEVKANETEATRVKSPEDESPITGVEAQTVDLSQKKLLVGIGIKGRRMYILEFYGTPEIEPSKIYVMAKNVDAAQKKVDQLKVDWGRYGFTFHVDRISHFDQIQKKESVQIVPGVFVRNREKPYYDMMTRKGRPRGDRKQFQRVQNDLPIKSKGKDTLGRDIPDWAGAEVYHATDKDGKANILANGYRILNSDEQSGYYGTAISFTPSIGYASSFGDKVTVGIISEEANILNLNDEADWNTWSKLTKNVVGGAYRDVAMKNGIDGVYDPGAGDLFIYNDNAVSVKKGGIQFQRNMEAEGDLVVLHNLGTEQLLQADELGGLPVPSIGITDPTLPFNGFGDVTLVGNYGMIDPTKPGNEVYEADIYSGIIPTKIYDFSFDGIQDWVNEHQKDLDDVGSSIGATISPYSGDEWRISQGLSGMLNTAEQSAGLKYLFLLANGVKVRLLQMKRPMSTNRQVLEQEPFQKFIKLHPGESLDTQTVYADKKFLKVLTEAYEKSMGLWLKSLGRDFEKEDITQWTKLDDAGLIQFGTLDRVIHGIKTLNDMVVDRGRIGKTIRSKVDKIGLDKYRAWVEEEFKDFFWNPHFMDGKKKVRWSLDNIVDTMTRKRTRVGEGGMTYGLGKSRAAVAKRLNNLLQIKKQGKKLVSQEKIKDMKKELNDEFFNLSNMFTGYYKWDDTFDMLDDLSKTIRDYNKNSKIRPTYDGQNRDILKNALVRNGFDVLQNFWEKEDDLLMNFADKVKNSPTQFMEAKPQRAVEISEFSTAIIPKGSSKELVSTLKKHGLKIVEYEKYNESERMEAVMKEKQLHFSRFGGDTKKADMKWNLEAKNLLSQAVQGAKVLFLNENAYIQRGGERQTTGFFDSATGEIVINTNMARKDSIFHEFAHPYMNYLKENKEDVYNQGIDLVRDSEYHNKAKKLYEGEATQLDEAIVQAIADKGVGFMDEKKRNKFKAWLKRIFFQFKHIMRKFTGAKMTLDDFTSDIAYKLQAGKPLVKVKPSDFGIQRQPHSIKLTGKFGAGGIRFEEDVFYSAAEKIVIEKFPDSMVSMSVKNWMKKQQIKPEEVDWLDIDGLVKGKKRVTREEMIDWVRSHKVQLQDIWYVEDWMATNEYRAFDKKMINKYGDRWNKPPKPGHISISDVAYTRPLDMSSNEAIRQTMVNTGTSPASIEVYFNVPLPDGMRFIKIRNEPDFWRFTRRLAEGMTPEEARKEEELTATRSRLGDGSGQTGIQPYLLHEHPPGSEGRKKIIDQILADAVTEANLLWMQFFDRKARAENLMRPVAELSYEDITDMAGRVHEKSFLEAYKDGNNYTIENPEWDEADYGTTYRNWDLMDSVEDDEYGAIKMKYAEPSKQTTGFQLTGGKEDYRELVIKMPRYAPDMVMTQKEYYETVIYPEMSVISIIAKAYPKTWEEAEKNEYVREASIEKYNQFKSKENYIKGEFVPHMYSIPGVMIWVRFNTRYDHDGNKVLFLEEFQSDWHQEAADVGYASQDDIREYRELKKAKSRAAGVPYVAETVLGLNVNQKGNIIFDYPRGEALSEEQLKRYYELDAKLDKQVPDAPFKGGGWVTIALKRMMQYAAVNGFDKIAWTTSNQQVQRWQSNLRKNVDAIHWTRSGSVPTGTDIPEGAIKIWFWRSFGRKPEDDPEYFKEWVKRFQGTTGTGASLQDVMDADRYELWVKIQSELYPDTGSSVRINGIKNKTSIVNVVMPVDGVTTIGDKEYTLKKLIGTKMAGQIKRGLSSGETNGVFEGDNLSIGSGVFRHYYDEVMVKAAERMGKIFNAKVGVVDLGETKWKLTDVEKIFKIDKSMDGEYIYHVRMKRKISNTVPLMSHNQVFRKVDNRTIAVNTRHWAGGVERGSGQWIGKLLSGEGNEQGRQNIIATRLKDYLNGKTTEYRHADVQPSIDISPEMRESLNANPQPQFQRVGNGETEIIAELEEAKRTHQQYIDDPELTAKFSGGAEFHRKTIKEKDFVIESLQYGVHRAEAVVFLRKWIKSHEDWKERVTADPKEGEYAGSPAHHNRWIQTYSNAIDLLLPSGEAASPEKGTKARDDFTNQMANIFNELGRPTKNDTYDQKTGEKTIGFISRLKELGWSAKNVKKASLLFTQIKNLGAVSKVETPGTRLDKQISVFEERIEEQGRVIEETKWLSDEQKAARTLRNKIKAELNALVRGHRLGMRDEEVDLRAIKMMITRYAKKHLPKTGMTGGMVNPLLNVIKGAKALSHVRAAFNRIDVITEKVHRKQYLGALLKMLRGTKPKFPGGRPIGKLMPDVQKDLDEIRTVVSHFGKLTGENEWSGELAQTRISSLHEIAEKEGRDLNEDERMEVLKLGFVGINRKSTSELETLYGLLYQMIQEQKTIRNIIDSGRKEFINGITANFVDVITGGEGVKTTMTARTLGLAPKSTGFAKQFLYTGVQSFEWILDIISQLDTTSGELKSPINKFFTKKVLAARNKYNTTVREWNNAIIHKLHEIYGNPTNSFWGRRKVRKLIEQSKVRLETGIMVHQGREEKDGGEEQLIISQREAYKKWMEWQDERLSGEQKTFENMGYTQDTIDELEKFMGQELLEYAKWQLDVFYPMVYADVNPVYRRMFFIDLPFHDRYSPIYREKEIVPEDDPMLGHVDNMITAVSQRSLKSRVNSNIALKYIDGHATMMNHVVDMAHFIAYGELIRDLRAILQNAQVKKSISQYVNPHYNKVIGAFIDDLARGGVDRSALFLPMEKLSARFSKYALAGNIMLLPKQIASFPAFVQTVPVKDMAKFGKHLGKFWAEIPTMLKTLSKSQVLQARYSVGWERDVKMALAKGFDSTLSGITPITDMLLLTTKIGDKAAILYGGWALYQYTYEKAKGKGLSDEKASELAMFEFEAGTLRTQQSADVENLGFLQRVKTIGRLFTKFMTAPISYYRSELGAWRNLYSGRGDKLTHVRNIALFHVVLPVLFQWVANLFMVYDDDDDKKWRLTRAAVLGSLNNFLFVYDAIAMIYDYALRGKTEYPDYDSEPVITEYMTKMMRVAKETHELSDVIIYEGTNILNTALDPEAHGHEEAKKAIWEFSYAVVDMVGLWKGFPVRNMKNLGEGWYDYWDGQDPSALRLLGVSEKAVHGKKGVHGLILRENVQDGSEISWKNSIRNHYIKTGKTEKQINMLWVKDKKLYRVHRKFGFKNDNVNELIRSISVDEKVRILLKMKKDISEDEWKVFRKVGKSEKHGTLISSNVNDALAEALRSIRKRKARSMQP